MYITVTYNLFHQNDFNLFIERILCQDVTTAILILTLNEIDGMKKIVPKINKNWAEEILLVDGGSTDGTIEEAERQGLKVLRQKIKGHGAAILEGVEATTSDNIVIFGPDGNHEPDEIPILIEKIKEGYDQVLISRFGKGSINLDADIVERFGNKMFAFLVNVFFGGQWTDTLTQQMSIRGLKKRQKILELVGNEGERIGGKKKMRPLPVGYDLSRQILREFAFWH
ncbi:MAG: glycosyltransferase family 2 protein [Nitrososphaeria archaeon]|nr:glycosyltransferase family 2 protein [Nitrososphaeria archaeon]